MKTSTQKENQRTDLVKAKASYTPVKWDEHPYDQASPPMRMTKASVEYKFQGELEGVGHTEYVMFYTEFSEINPHTSTAVYVGLTRFTGTLRGKSGSFVLEERGTFKGGRANAVVTILNGSGTEEFHGIWGSGKASADQKGAEIELTFTVP